MHRFKFINFPLVCVCSRSIQANRIQRHTHTSLVYVHRVRVLLQIDKNNKIKNIWQIFCMFNCLVCSLFLLAHIINNNIRRRPNKNKRWIYGCMTQFSRRQYPQSTYTHKIYVNELKPQEQDKLFPLVFKICGKCILTHCMNSNKSKCEVSSSRRWKSART